MIVHMANSFAKRADQQDLGHLAPVMLDVWVFLNLFSNMIMLSAIVATFLIARHTLRRHPTLINVCITFILSGIFCNLLFFAGQHKGPEPSKGLCIAQTSLLYATTPMWSVSVLMLVCHISTACDMEEGALRKNYRVKLVAMLVAPYLTLFAFAVPTLVLSLKRPDLVNRERRFFYCSLKDTPLTNTMSIFTSVVCLCITITLGLIARTLYKKWSSIRTRLDFQIVLRVLIFGGYVFIGMFVSVFSIYAQHTSLPDLFAASFGTCIVIVFGTQPDILRTWCFWHRTKKTTGQWKISLPSNPTWSNSLDSMRYETNGDSEKLFIKELPRIPMSAALADVSFLDVNTPPEVPPKEPPKAHTVTTPRVVV